ncbi:hypothetical protein NECAME_16664 [Necator americanus]|uniref:Uncharacterized protein n=1 Tax=Necator americanus TaxID=51031 RepID=W2TXM1_NECAM|nr:hypothetical protein NECAME_16664 [Necator americanus]ETN85762.1 hypothetical protein NECAME_16664 [Necator americanus]
MNCFNAPSVALTYKNVPDLSQSFTKPAVLLDILCSFSIRISLKHLCRNTAREIPCLNGLKVLSTIWKFLSYLWRKKSSKQSTNDLTTMNIPKEHETILNKRNNEKNVGMLVSVFYGLFFLVRQQEDWSREQSLIGKGDGRTEEPPMRNKSIDLEQFTQ